MLDFVRRVKANPPLLIFMSAFLREHFDRNGGGAIKKPKCPYISNDLTRSGDAVRQNSFGAITVRRETDISMQAVPCARREISSKFREPRIAMPILDRRFDFCAQIIHFYSCR